MIDIDKGKLHHWLGVIRRLKLWQLIVLLVMVTFVAAFLLRENNLGMVQRRDTVKQADKDNKDVQQKLVDLQNYVSGHMNTDMGQGIYLQYSYDRDYDKAIAQASNASNPNSAQYQQASLDCRSKFVGGSASFRNDYVQCVIDKVGSLGGASDPLSSLKAPDVNLYRYTFLSPFWSPDLAGFTVLIAAVLAVIIIIRIVLSLTIYLLLKRRAR